MFSELFNKYLPQKQRWFAILFLFLIIFLCKNPDISIMLFVTIIFATALNPVVDKLEAKMKRPLATALVLTAFLLIIAIFILPVLYLSVYEIVEFAKAFPQYITNINNVLNGMPFLKSLGLSNLSSDVLTSAFTNSSTNIFESVFNFISETSTAFLYIFTSVILLFFFIVDKKQVKDAFIKIFPNEYRKKTSELLSTVSEKLSGYVVAQTIVSGSVWVTLTIGLLIFKVNYAILLGVISGILSIIPVVGSVIALIICLIATYEMGLKYLIIVTVLYLLSHFIENNMVRPYVYSKFLNLHQIIVFIAIIVGAKYHGVLGVILGPPFAMALYILLEELYIKKMDEH